MDARRKASQSCPGSTEHLAGHRPKDKDGSDGLRISRPTRMLLSTNTCNSERKRRTQSPATRVAQRRKSDDPPFAGMPLTLTPRMALPLRERRYTTEFATPECFGIVAFESPKLQTRTKCGSSGDILETCLEDSSGIVVAVRVRPFTARETSEPDVHCVVSMEGNETVVTLDKGDVYRFTYDYSFWSFDSSGPNYADQVQVYEMLAKPLLNKVFEGYNTCLFAYGQTGSGKSYSIMGHGPEVGIVPRFCEDLFERIDANTSSSVKLNVEISFFEIYNEKIHDLLTSSTKEKSNKKANLKVREHPVIGPYVEGLSSYAVKSFDDVSTWITIGNQRRATAATGINDNSSRSHSVFTLLLTQTRTDNIDGECIEQNVTSRINLVDLAGSERQSQAKTSGDRLREGASINRSLMTLGKVISNLSENSLHFNKKKKLYIPYRESVLTWLLKESLGGNSKTAMLATISPSSSQAEETLSSLRYARQARYIINTARVNEDPNAKLVRDLRAEIEKLKGQAGLISDDGYKDEVDLLKEMLLRKEKELAELKWSWQERIQKSEERIIEEAKLLEKTKITMKLDNRLPNLVNLNEDPQLSEVLLYILQEGTTIVGRRKDDCTHEIQLNGPLIEDDHCVFQNHQSVVTVSPIGKAVTYVNGTVITEAIVLHHGDRVVLGGNHYFRFGHPLELPKDQATCPTDGALLSNSQLKDFEFARQELAMKQNTRLEAELEQVRLKHEEEMKRLEQQKTEAQLSMEKQLAKTQESARTAIDRYEDRLSELSRLLDGLRHEKLESAQSRLEAKERIDRLEAEKEYLKHQLSVVDVGQRVELKSREEMPSSSFDSNLIQMLNSMVQKEKENLERAERRQLLPKSTNNLHQILLNLREANKISEFLKKDTKFVHEIKYEECKDQVLIKVIRTKLNVSTFWTLEKFEQKLSEMKEFYQNPDENNGVANEIFFDPSDIWESESRIAATPFLSENMKKGLRRQSSFGVVADLNITLGSLDLSFSSTDSPDSARAASVVGDSPSTSSHRVMELCQQLLKNSVDWFKSVSKESLADKYLQLCQSILQTVTDLRRCYETESRDSEHFVRMLPTQLLCFQLSSDYDSLSKVASVWLFSLNNIESEAVADLCHNVKRNVTSVGTRLQLLLQGYANSVDEIVSEASTGIVDEVYQLCQFCGQLSLATQMPIMSLVNDNQGSSCFKLGADVKLHFVNGCDEMVDRVLFAAIEKMEDFEIESIDLSEAFKPNAVGKNEVDSLLKQMQVTVSSVAVLLRKLQSVQVEVDATILAEKQRLSESVLLPDNHYYYGYCHCVQIITNIDGIVGGVSEMIQATHALVNGEDDQSSVNMILLSAELVSTASAAITAPSTDVDVLCSSFCNDLGGNGSILSDSQVELLELVADDVKEAADKICRLSKKVLASVRAH